jgi:hypothetical protein
MFIKLKCPNCGLSIDSISGVKALEYIDSDLTMNCFCGYDFHRVKDLTEDPILKKKPSMILSDKHPKYNRDSSITL